MAPVLAVAQRFPDDHVLGLRNLRAVAAVVRRLAQLDGGRTAVLDVSCLEL